MKTIKLKMLRVYGHVLLQQEAKSMDDLLQAKVHELSKGLAVGIA
jgi:hypothetical protein